MALPVDTYDVKLSPSRQLAVLATSLAVVVVALSGIILLAVGHHHDLATSLIVLAVVTTWIPIALCRKLDP